MKNFSITLFICLCSYISIGQNFEINNLQSNSLNTKTDGVDIGAGLIESPLSDYCGFEVLEPAVWYVNYGTETINSFTASYRLDFYPLVVQNITETILPGDSILVYFDPATVPAGNHAIQFGCSSPNNTTDANSSNNSKSTAFNYANGTQTLISIMTDNYGYETSWTLTNAASETVASGSNYASNSLHTTLLCLPAGCYTFTINDSYGDGICAGFGDGFYLIENLIDETEIATGCDFDFTESAVFCIESPPGPPVANFTHSQPNNCTGEVSFMDLSSCNPAADSWLWHFGDGNSSTEQNPTHYYLSNGYYSVSLLVTNSNGTSTISVPNSVLIERGLPPIVSDQHFCDGENVSFFSPENEIFEWFTSANSSTPIQTASNISFANLQNDTTIYYQYFVEPEYYNFGLEDNSGLGGYFGFSIDRAIYFDAISDVTITKAKVFASGAASRTITLKNSGGIVLDTRVINIPDGESIIDLNFEVLAGEDYAIHVNTANNLSYTGDYSGPDVGYPFTVPGIISITGNNFSNSFWYFFYDIEVFQGFGSGCTSSRESAHAIMSSQTVNLGNDTTVCNGQGIFLNAGDYTDYEWSTGSSNQEIEVVETGEYLITVTDQYTCDATGSINITIADELVYNEIIVHPSEIGANDGSIEIEIISGAEPYEIVWSDSSTEFTLSNLAPGLYSYTITDSYLCDHFGQIEIFSSVGYSNIAEIDFELFPNPASMSFS
ncbi:MAG: PKD domain-containing protein [Bacteroidales bacterium]|nr:PKD domain-containing protein [Bacteroidales bacterium]